jgi:CheY-like chemotaxis protein
VPGSAKILIIDDDDDYRASTRALLENQGHEVIEAASGLDGLSAADQHKPDLIILDVVMEHLRDGYDVNQAIKCSPQYQHLAKIPILMISSIQEDPETLYGWIGDAKPITPDAYLTKPLNVREFLDSVTRLLAR